ncbi:MAG: amino acid ABC transporter permease [Epsilonproteobacteria bacterium]|nr:amino acid ABC transporter permease [Campylobacterota bacterium]
MRFLRDEKIRGILYQLITIVGFVLFIVYIAQNTATNIEQRGIKTGFDFLNSTAGFDITESPIPFSPQHTHWDVYKVGLLNTLIVSFWGIVFSTILGLIIGVWRLSSNWLINRIAAAYIEIFRNIPLLLQILFWYNVVLATLPSTRNSISIGDIIFINNRGFFMPDFKLQEGAWIVGLAVIVAIGLVVWLVKWANRKQELTGEQIPVFLYSILILITLPTIAYFIAGEPISATYPVLKGFNFEGGKVYTPEFLALLFALTIYTATFIAEAIRSGIEAVPKGQKEAAISLGLSPWQRLRLVILPQAVRIAIPSIINQYLNLIKNSSLAAAIGYPELVTIFAGTSLNQTGQALEILLITMLTYLAISLIVSLILNWFNNKMKIKER